MTRTGPVDIFLRFGVPDFLWDLLLILWYARGRQCDRLVPWNAKKASEFALQAAGKGRTIVVSALAVPEGESIPACGPGPVRTALFFLCFYSLSSNREWTSTSVSHILSPSILLGNGETAGCAVRRWSVYVLSACRHDKLCSECKHRVHNREHLEEGKVQMRPRGKWFSDGPFLITNQFMTS